MIDGGNVLNGISIAINSAKSGDMVLLHGSFYVVGEFLKNFQERGRVLP
jgi:folylpolyglutamate synthase/dihydropteroate synthase